ncbi:MAG: DUF4270 family protein [Bacteroidia bacterium]|nr:DUF4270 domain-containing protein [Bacteroidia bacterium]MDW8015149.1 DUF4270 family protein [Bacteroidia bacterium]
MRKKTLFLLLALCGNECRNPRRIGEEVFPPPPLRQDTFYLTHIQQVFLPPPVTNNLPFVFMGQTEDTFTGRWKAGWATNFALGGNGVQFVTQELIAVDSVILELFIASSYGDFSAPMRLRVEKLLHPLSAEQTYTTESTFLTEGQNLVLPGRDSLYFTTVRPGGYRFPLDTSLGRQILSLPPTALSGDKAFQTAFPGLYLSAEPLNSDRKAAIYTVFPRSVSTVLRVYYREKIQTGEAPQRYDFFITDSCTWAFSLVREGGHTLRDRLLQDSLLWRHTLLVAGGLPVGIRFHIEGWERLYRRPILSARLFWFSDSATAFSYNPFYPRPASLALYADTTGEVASASWGFGEFSGERVIWELTQPIQEIALGRRPKPASFYVWLSGRAYTLQRWLAAGESSSTPPYLIVTSAEP